MAQDTLIAVIYAKEIQRTSANICKFYYNYNCLFTYVID